MFVWNHHTVQIKQAVLSSPLSISAPSLLILTSKSFSTPMSHFYQSLGILPDPPGLEIYPDKLVSPVPPKNTKDISRPTSSLLSPS